MKISARFLLPFMLVTAAIISVPLYSQKKVKPPAPSFVRSSAHPFAILWQQADSLAALGQPRSALEVVEKIYRQAKKDQNDPQWIKAVIYRIRLNSEFQEDFLPRIMAGLKKEMEEAQPPSRQILQSILAEVYWKYYQNNQYRFRDRTRIGGNLPDSVETWDLNTLAQVIAQTYLLSLGQPDSLEKTPIGRYEVILEAEVFREGTSDSLKKEAARFTPTLYDFLAGRALDYFTSAQGGINLPARRFEVDQPWYFSTPGEYAVRRAAIPPDPGAPASYALRIFSDLAAFHLDDKDRRALIETNLRRLEFVHERSTLAGRDSLYADALKKFEHAETASPWSASVSFARATFLHSQGERYQPFVPGPFRWMIREALEVCNRAVQLYPGSEGGVNCSLLAKTITRPFLQITTEKAVVPEKPSLALLGVKNAGEVSFRLVKADPELYREKSSDPDREALNRYLASLPPVKSWQQKIPDEGDYQQHQAQIALPELPSGFWILLAFPFPEPAAAGSGPAHAAFWSTRISYAGKQNSNDGSYGYFLLDRETGHPLTGAVAELWEKRYNYRERNYSDLRLEDYRPDDQGYVEVPASGNENRAMNRYLRIRLDDDLLVTDNFYQYPVVRTPEQTFTQTFFYTDRAIYRPGQSIHFKGIVITRTGEITAIRPNHRTTVVFRDVNGQKVSEMVLTSNEFGSISGTFTAPLGVLAGEMSIANETGSVPVSVEEYKRPTFEVTGNPVEGNYRLGSPVTVTGSALAYSGNPVDGAKVGYRVVRRARFPYWDWSWRWPMPASPEVEIAGGSTITGNDGSFSITFPALPDPTVGKASMPVFDFTVYADVTSGDGETRSVQLGVSAGYRSLLIAASLPETVNLALDTSAKITAVNLNGRKTPADVTVTLQRLRQPDRAFRKRAWERPDMHLVTAADFRSKFPYDVYDDEDNPEMWGIQETLISRTLRTDADSILALSGAGGNKPLPGTWLLTLKAVDPFGDTVVVKRYLTFFSPVSREVPVQALGWFVPLKSEGEPGQSARFLVGSKEDDVRVMLEIRKNDSVLSREWLRLNDRVLSLDIPVREDYRGNVSANFLFIKHNRSFQFSRLITVPHRNRKLDITIGSFRDRLEPGASEQWTVRVTGPAGKPVRAELLASLYDASLDLFRPNQWSFHLYQRFSGIYPWNDDQAFGTSRGQYLLPAGTTEGYRTHPALRLNWFGAAFFSGRGYMRYSRGMTGKGGDMQMDELSLSLPETTSAKAESSEAPPPSPSGSGTDNGTGGEKGRSGRPDRTPVPQIRRDMRETAFFYPVLRSDSAGELTLAFTVPESLTRWKLMGLAHTKALDVGLLEKELVTRKDLMVYPNAPRFLRQGDTVIFSARIANLSGGDLSGSAVLDLNDGITGRERGDLLAADGRTGGRADKFDVKKGLSTVVSWKLVIPVATDLSLLRFRITATAGNFSDGEERNIPVLTNRMMVTESLPLPVRGKGTSAFTFGKLTGSADAGGSASMKNYRLTLEFASNPAWYAIQALPSLNEKSFENADAIFAAWWSNSLAAHIAQSNPKIRAVFDAWKNLTPDALQSNLSKNQDLKTALLQETPWVVQANSESGRKQRLGLFFDRDNLAMNLAENFRKLEKLQSPNGGWSWFAGMPENRYITQNILTGMARLHHLGVRANPDDPALRRMMEKAVRYLDGELAHDYQELVKYRPASLGENHLGGIQIQYLYARSLLSGIPGFSLDKAARDAQKAFDYYRKQAETWWLKQDRHLQGMIALSLDRLGNKEVPALIAKSLSEKALHSGEMGMYWAGDGGYNWYQAPVETQALMIELFDEVAGDREAVEEMKVWLLKQKQTQDWRSGRATLEACYALLLRGTDLLADDSGVKITLGKRKIDPADMPDLRMEAGTGYFRLSWQGSEITPDMGNITVTKKGEGTAWGGLYWQYFEDLDRITPAATPLKLEKQVFTERNTPSGPELVPVTGSLNVGDKLVVRIVVRVDRDMEYIHLKDLRASSLEPLSPRAGEETGGGLSGYRYRNGMGYYQSTTDVATHFFFDYLPKGTWVFEYGLKVNAGGSYSNGITSVQCMYAPEFSAHSEGIRIAVQQGN